MQPTMTLSPIEVEYIAITFAIKEVTWLRFLLIELGLVQPNQQHIFINALQNNINIQSIH